MLVAVVAAVPARAADDGTITISNATQGRNYSVYKIFDATYSGSNVSYTYDGSNSKLLANLQAATNLFTVNKVGDTYNVIMKSDVTESDVIQFFRDNGPTYDSENQTWSGGNYGAAVKTEAANSTGSLTIRDLAYGYYFVTTTSGSTVTIDTVAKDATVIDKNQTIPVPDKQESVDDGTTWKYEGTTQENPTPTASIGDTVSYKVTGSFTQYVGSTAVTNLVFTDVMSDGLDADQNVVVKVNDSVLSTYKETKNGETQANKVGEGEVQYTVTYIKNDDNTWTTTITIPTATVDGSGNVTAFTYNAANTYEITYSAKKNRDAIQVDPENNTVTMKYNNDVTVETDTTKVAHYQVTLNKKDGKNSDRTDDDTALAGAKFRLYTQGGQAPLNIVLITGTGYGNGTAEATSTNTYRLAESGETTGVITEMTAGADGKIVVQGLKNGSYEFEETVAPDGYNRLTARTNVATITDADASIDVINNAGPQLPSTGGAGTVLFYVVGGALIVGAVAFAVARRRAGDR